MSESRPQQKEIRGGYSPPLPLLCADRDHLVAHRVGKSCAILEKEKVPGDEARLKDTLKG